VAPPTSSDRIVFPPYTTITEQVRTLIRQMQTTGQFSHEIAAWQETSLHRFSDLRTPEARWEAAIRLSFLNSMTSCACEALCIPLLKELLPPQTPVDAFLDKFESLYIEEEANRQMISEVLSWITQQESLLITRATQARTEILKEFQQLKQRAEALHSQRGAGLTSLRTEVSALTERVHQVQIQLQRVAEQASQMSLQFAAEQKEMVQIANHWRKV
jgi:hypothetical protein